MQKKTYGYTEYIYREALDQVSSLGWFGFSADPPTIAHRNIVEAVLESGLVEKVLVFPAGKLAYKDFQASDWQRVEMVELWKRAAGFGQEVLISHFDLERQKATAWFDLWQSALRLAPDLQHFLIVGSDQYSMIGHSWYRGEELLNEASFLIVPRDGFPLSSLPSGHRVLDHTPITGSSTDVRQGDMSGVDEAVKAFIIEHDLYR